MVSENPSPGPSTAGSSQAMGVSLTLETVLGSTNPSINTLSAAVDAQCFAFCAGSIVVLSDIQSLGQRFFYAKPDALPAHVTPSYYNPATPTKATGNRALANTPTKDDSLLSLATFDSNVDHPAKRKLSHRSRSVTSVALSPSGQYLAVGEVRSSISTGMFSVSKLNITGRLPSTYSRLLDGNQRFARHPCSMPNGAHVRRPSHCIFL